MIRIIREDDGQELSWQELLHEIALSDIVVVGEMHDDAVGHAVELLIVEDVTTRWPDTVLSLEMLERDEQVFVDDYRDGLIDSDVFQRETGSTNWAGNNSFDLWYQPLIDTAHNNGSSVVAANAPRRYVKVARRDGYGALEALPAPRRNLISLPLGPADEAYFDRFSEVMGGHGEDATDPQVIDDLFRAQRLWDETMADAIVTASKQGERKVIHIVGQFHSDFDGGLVDAVEVRAPDAGLLVISMQPTNDVELNNDDVGRADLIIYTGSKTDP